MGEEGRGRRNNIEMGEKGGKKRGEERGRREGRRREGSRDREGGGQRERKERGDGRREKKEEEGRGKAGLGVDTEGRHEHGTQESSWRLTIFIPSCSLQHQLDAL